MKFCLVETVCKVDGHEGPDDPLDMKATIYAALSSSGVILSSDSIFHLAFSSFSFNSLTARKLAKLG